MKRLQFGKTNRPIPAIGLLVEELRYMAWDKCTAPARVAQAWLQPSGEAGTITLSHEEIRRLDALAGTPTGKHNSRPLMAALNG